MKDIITECEKSFYRELYQLGEKNQWIVIDITTEKLYLRKNLEVYNEEVLSFLKEHTHPNLPRVITFFPEEDGTVTLIEDYLQGETLSAHLSGRDLSPEKKKEVVLRVLDALSFLHHANPSIIHRDVKPDNIMLTDDGGIFLVDYDAAKVHRQGQKRDTVLLGTEGIAAPEQYGFAQSDVRTDLYAVGALLQVLFPEEERLSTVIDRAKRMDPEDRYQNVEELREAFLDALDFGKGAPGKRAAEKPGGAGNSGNGSRKKKKRGMGLLVAVLIGVVGIQAVLAILFFPREKATPNTAPEHAVESLPAASEGVTESYRGETEDGAEEAAEKILPPELLEQGYTIMEGKASFGVAVRNPNPEYALRNVCIYATVKGKNGEVLAADYARIRYIAAGDTIFFGSSDQLIWNEGEGETLEIYEKHDEKDVILQEGSDVLYQKDLPVTNASFSLERYGVRHTGEVENLCEKEVDAICITGVYRRNGRIIGGWYDFVETLGVGEKRAFDIDDYYFDADFDRCDVCALLWNRET